MQTKPSQLARLLSLNASAVNGFTNKDVPGFEVYRAVVDAYEKSCADYAGETWAENVEAERRRYEGSLLEFFTRAWHEIDPAPFELNWHHEEICAQLESMARGEYRDLICNQPFRTGKSILISVCFPAWIWAQQPNPDFPLIGPQASFLCVSYGAIAAEVNAVKMLRLVAGEWYQQYWGDRVRIRSDQSGRADFGNTAGGERISNSIEGGILGRGGLFQIIDDPHKVDAVESESERERTIRALRESLPSRVTDPRISARIMVMQRLHESDATAYARENWPLDSRRWIMFPMRYDESRPCEYDRRPDFAYEVPQLTQQEYLGMHKEYSSLLARGRKLPDFDAWSDLQKQELLWPSRFTDREVMRLENELGPYASSGQLQQEPTPRGGGIIEKDWWQVWPEVPPPLGQPVQLPDVSFVLVSLDTAISEEEQASYNACTVWGIWHRAPNAPRTQRVTDSGADMRGVFADRAGMVERAFLIPEWVGRLPQSEQEEWLKQRREKTLRYTPTNYAHDLRDEEQPRIILMEAWRRRCRLHDPTLGPDGQPKGLVERVLDTARRRHANALVIENKTRGKDVQQELQRMMRAAEFGVHLFEPRKHGDKVSRLLSVQPLFTGGLVYAPVAYDPVTGEQQEFRWCQSVISEIAQVPKGQFNDLADSSSQGLIWLREAGLILLTEEHIQEQLESRAFRPKRESVAQHYGV